MQTILITLTIVAAFVLILLVSLLPRASNFTETSIHQSASQATGKPISQRKFSFFWQALP